MPDYEVLLKETSRKLSKALEHLDYSYNKISNLPDQLSDMDDEIMETWESYSSRFARVSDIFVTQFLRTKIALEEPGFKGTTRDYLNKAEKLGLITDANEWAMIRELRNAAAHEYNDEDLTAFYQKLKSLCPTLLSIKSVIGS
ncbi:MAG: hypothetical protein CMF50_02475 [Legionellales bacterium]|mgnify:CR=1 FL=1|nr:hypothetical protein [Legionellales bacterium]|tara:strand:+ start:39693 stop:40121 length:429 start_codon:yes stop_codon:yes gene_type:complete